MKDPLGIDIEVTLVKPLSEEADADTSTNFFNIWLVAGTAAGLLEARKNKPYSEGGKYLW
jgi:hypothetical protein